MNIPIIDAGLDLARSIVNVIDQAVEDKDLTVETAARIKISLAETQSNYLSAVMTTEHVPKTVKVLYAIGDLSVKFIRPLGSVFCIGYLIWSNSNGIATPEWLQVVLATYFPAWSVSRHMEKARTDKIKLEKATRVVTISNSSKEQRDNSHYLPIDPNDVG